MNTKVIIIINKLLWVSYFKTWKKRSDQDHFKLHQKLNKFGVKSDLTLTQNIISFWIFKGKNDGNYRDDNPCN